VRDVFRQDQPAELLGQKPPMSRGSSRPVVGYASLDIDGAFVVPPDDNKDWGRSIADGTGNENNTGSVDDEENENSNTNTNSGTDNSNTNTEDADQTEDEVD